jgi:hypothetical protein
VRGNISESISVDEEAGTAGEVVITSTVVEMMGQGLPLRAETKYVSKRVTVGVDMRREASLRLPLVMMTHPGRGKTTTTLGPTGRTREKKPGTLPRWFSVL